MIMMIDLERDALRQTLTTADRRTLSAVVTHLSGDVMRVPQGYDRDMLADLAVEVLEPYLDGSRTVDVPSDELLHAAMELASGEHVDPAYGPLVREHVALGEPLEPKTLHAPEGFSVLIIGSGVTGVLAGITLANLGFTNFTIIERDTGPGGTWRQNTYPGCRVDTPSLLYSYSFEPDYLWPEHFSHQPALLEYVETVVEKYRLTPHMRYHTSVTAMTWDDAEAVWRVDLEQGDGSHDHVTATFVIGALGLLRVPKLPDIPGQSSFTGESYHSAQWGADVDLVGKRVGVIGTGASSNQIVPAISPVVDQLTVFQRSPNWIIEHPQYGKLIAGTERMLIADIPTYASWYRFRHFWTLGDRAFQMLEVDPEWPNPERSANLTSDLFRAQLTEDIVRKVDGDTALIEKLTPDYPPFGKRMLIDNGWFEALKRHNVELDTSPIDRIVPEGIETKTGLVELDVIIYATGFQADKVLYPIQVTGQGGVDVSARLDEQPEAYLGMAIESCPNLMVSPGPNGVPGHAGNGMFYAECQVAYIVECLRTMFDNGYTRMEVKPESVQTFVAEIIEELEGLIWGRSDFSNWYRGSRDRVTAILPRRILDFWTASNNLDPEAYQWS
jgi:4-hydroxyacetophenone monooxygenase